MTAAATAATRPTVISSCTRNSGGPWRLDLRLFMGVCCIACTQMPFKMQPSDPIKQSCLLPESCSTSQAPYYRKLCDCTSIRTCCTRRAFCSLDTGGCLSLCFLSGSTDTKGLGFAFGLLASCSKQVYQRHSCMKPMRKMTHVQWRSQKNYWKDDKSRRSPLDKWAPC